MHPLIAQGSDWPIGKILVLLMSWVLNQYRSYAPHTTVYYITIATVGLPCHNHPVIRALSLTDKGRSPPAV